MTSEHTAAVAGVAVDTRHWIGGARVGSPTTFTDASPVDGRARGGGGRVGRPARAPAPRPPPRAGGGAPPGLAGGGSARRAP
ncbi:betaine-aldehyde dehydrogenase, partial [Streptomyces violascens]